jgi:acetyltransferase-like isoleucine patch superfamily enzyme
MNKIGDFVFIDETVSIHDFINIYGLEEWPTKIGPGTSIGCFTEIGGAAIGQGCKIQAHVYICPGVTIGDEVHVGPGVRFTNDKRPDVNIPCPVIPTIVRDGASIGAGAIILPGVEIGKKAMVGAGAVVTKDVPPGETVVGCPAREMEGQCAV